jgi:hypothetical protein
MYLALFWLQEPHQWSVSPIVISIHTQFRVFGIAGFSQNSKDIAGLSLVWMNADRLQRPSFP